MNTDLPAFWNAILDAHSLMWQEFRPAWAATLIAALVLPSVGLHASFRRHILTTIALPQATLAGMALVLAWPAVCVGSEGEPAALPVLLGALAGTALGLLLAARFRSDSVTRGVATMMIAALALTDIARGLSPFGETRLEPLLHGEVLGLSTAKLALVAFLLVPGLYTMSAGRRWVLTAAWPDAARAAGVSTRLASIEFSAVLGLVVMLGTITLGPAITAGLLIIPTAFARHRGNDVRGCFKESTATGLLAAWWGPVLAVIADIPLGGGVIAVALVAGAAARMLRRRTPR